MKDLERGVRFAVGMLLMGALLAGCSTFGDDPGIAANDQPAQLPPVADSAVSSNSLPPIGGAGGATPSYDDGTNVAGNSLPPVGATPAGPGGGQQAALSGGVGAPPPAGAPGAAAPGSFVSLNDVNQPPAAGARDLSGGLTPEKLLGGWTVTSGTSQCRLNFTYTSTGNSDHYRASAPGCVIATLAQVGSWRLSGSQVQLFDTTDRLVGVVNLSGGRFIGTLSGGQAITMAS
jgi:hypothetical protein